MDNRPIALFDSGLGGLTALKALRELMPEENFIYFADSGRCPYGAKSAAQLRVMAREDLDFCAQKGAKAVIAACGTVSSTASSVLDGYSLPVIDVLRPSSDVLALWESAAPVGVIATAASIASGAYERRIHLLAPEKEVISVACPDFVTLIESGHRTADDALIIAAVEKYLAPMKAAKISCLLLGCTHYGLIAEAISGYLGEEVALVSASERAAGKMRDFLLENGLACEKRGKSGSVRYYTSGSAAEFAERAGLLLGEDISSCLEEVPALEVPQL